MGGPAALAGLRVLDPATTNRSTPREMTALLAAIWRDEAAGPAACAAMRRVLGLQIWPHRPASGSPADHARRPRSRAILLPTSRVARRLM
jgi:beta-lactamase class A